MIALFVKLVVISVGLAVTIKYLAPMLPIAATTTNALIGVLTPSLIMAGVLLWRSRQPSNLRP